MTGRYEVSNNNMLTLVVHEGSVWSSEANGLADEEFLFMGDDRFGSSQRNVTFRIARSSAGEVVGRDVGPTTGRSGRCRASSARIDQGRIEARRTPTRPVTPYRDRGGQGVRRGWRKQ